jgi:hypothetical protein
MTTRKKPAADPLVAAETILIEGKAFARGEAITGVSQEQIAIAASQRRVIRKSAFDALGVPAPELVPAAPEGEQGEEAGA